MLILAIDPGPEKSAFVTYNVDTCIIEAKAIVANDILVKKLFAKDAKSWVTKIVIEEIKCYGMPMGETTINTCVWIGRFIQAWNFHYDLIPRKTVCSILCGTAKANDSHIRQRLIDLFGPGKDKAIGKKDSPGPLYGVSKDIWSALGIAVAWAERQHSASKNLEDALT